jgi:hypothetical protein
MRSRLVQLIYFVGILQFVIVVGGVMAFVRAERRPMFMADTIHFLAHEVAAQSESPEALQGAVQRIYADLHWAISVYDDDGHLVASSGPPTGGAHDQRPFGGESPLAGSVPLEWQGRSVGRREGSRRRCSSSSSSSVFRRGSRRVHSRFRSRTSPKKRMRSAQEISRLARGFGVRMSSETSPTPSTRWLSA